jgi:hypothetical protein
MVIVADLIRRSGQSCAAPLRHSLFFSHPCRHDVEIRPFQSERFTASQSQCQGDNESRAISHGRGRVQDLPRFLHRERNDLVLIDTRRFGDLGHVLHDATAPHGLTERHTQRPVRQMHRRSCEALPTASLRELQLRVELFEMFGLQLVQSVRPDSRNQMVVHRRSVAHHRGTTHGRRRDVLNPMP